MTRLVKLTDGIYVNPRDVALVTRPAGGGVSIELRNGTRFGITEMTVREVAEALIPPPHLTAEDL